MSRGLIDKTLEKLVKRETVTCLDCKITQTISGRNNAWATVPYNTDARYNTSMKVVGIEGLYLELSVGSGYPSVFYQKLDPTGVGLAFFNSTTSSMTFTVHCYVRVAEA